MLCISSLSLKFELRPAGRKASPTRPAGRKASSTRPNNQTLAYKISGFYGSEGSHCDRSGYGTVQAGTNVSKEHNAPIFSIITRTIRT
jgi:hypothetical protein